jgi:sugar/nucleoside kinase (ribokinase family)
MDPETQLRVLAQMTRRPKLVAADTMDFWIQRKKEALTRVVQTVNVIFMDAGEARSFTQESNLVSAAKAISRMGPTTVVVKRGEHGVLLFSHDSLFSIPAFPLEHIVDPTGAGDSFAGGFMGYLAAIGETTNSALRRAAVLGSVMGSFAVESLSVERLKAITYEDLVSRLNAFADLTFFDGLRAGESLPWLGKDSPLEAKSKGGRSTP